MGGKGRLLGGEVEIERKGREKKQQQVKQEQRKREKGGRRKEKVEWVGWRGFENQSEASSEWIGTTPRVEPGRPQINFLPLRQEWVGVRLQS